MDVKQPPSRGLARAVRHSRSMEVLGFCPPSSRGGILSISATGDLTEISLRKGTVATSVVQGSVARYVLNNLRAIAAFEVSSLNPLRPVPASKTF